MKKVKVLAGIAALTAGAILVKKAYDGRLITLEPGKHHVKKVYNLDGGLTPVESLLTPKGYKVEGVPFTDIEADEAEYNYVNYKTVKVKANKLNEFGKTR